MFRGLAGWKRSSSSAPLTVAAAVRGRRAEGRKERYGREREHRRYSRRRHREFYLTELFR